MPHDQLEGKKMIREQPIYPISIKGSSKVVLSRLHGLHQVGSVGQVGVGVVATEVLQRGAVHSRIGRGSELLTQDLLHVRAHNCQGRTWEGSESGTG